jgi:uncharacterized protein YycO
MQFRLIMMVVIAITATTWWAHPATAASTSISDKATDAIASNDYETVGMALFSAESQADIDALTPVFERLRAQQVATRKLANPTNNWASANSLFQKITKDMALSNKLASSTYARMQKGDVILRRTGRQGCKIAVIVPLCQFWAFMYEHSGIYYGKRNKAYNEVYESTSDGGVQFKDVKTWQKGGLYVGIHRSAIDVYKIAATFERLINTYGTNGRTPYNFNLLNKQTNSALYCSQLVWKFYLMLGIDVDSNDPLYASWLRINYGIPLGNYTSTNAVAPDEVALTSKLFRVASGWNQ